MRAKLNRSGRDDRGGESPLKDLARPLGLPAGGADGPQIDYVDRWIYQEGCAVRITCYTPDTLTLNCYIHGRTAVVQRHLQGAGGQTGLGCWVNPEHALWEAFQAYVLGYAASKEHHGRAENPN